MWDGEFWGVLEREEEGRGGEEGGDGGGIPAFDAQ